MTSGQPGRPPEYIVAEYEAATAAYLAYDSYRWQSGSLLIAGAFVFLGLLASAPTDEMIDFGAFIVAFVMSLWLLYSQHHRNLFLFKLDRVAELEAQMGGEQNLRFRGAGAKQYRRVGPAGHHMDRIMALGLCCAGPGLALLKGSAGLFSILAVLLAVGSATWVIVQERAAQALVAGPVSPPSP